jgi:transcriptional regulator with XRE-family HTH domain
VTAKKQRPLSPQELAVMERIDQARAAKGLSWSKLALACGRTTSAGSQWSSRLAYPSQRTFNLIAQALEVSQAWLLRGDEDEPLPKARTKRQAELLRIMDNLTAEQEAAVLAAAQGIAAHLTKK